MRLEGRYAIVTGASHGLGAAIARRFVAEGASLLLCARNEDEIGAVAERLIPSLSQGQRVLFRRTDVSIPADVEALVAAALEAFPRLDVLVNNAGVYGPMGCIEDVSWETWREALEINLMGTVCCCRAVLSHFKEQRYGKIINLSGGGATSPLPRFSAYAASKAGIVRFSETIAEEVREFGIDVNAVAPGALATRLMDQSIDAGPEAIGADFWARMKKTREDGGTPLEVPAELCAYLASAASDGLTGKLISAVWDPWRDFADHRTDLDGTDVYTLRRIIPGDRHMTWGDD